MILDVRHTVGGSDRQRREHIEHVKPLVYRAAVEVVPIAENVLSDPELCLKLCQI
jgi:hypothetical protein